MKKFKKIILLVLIFIAGFGIGNAVKYYLDMWRADMSVQTFLNAIEAPYKNDNYGGATPEETFDMYLTALKKGDLELASKYFVIGKQENRLAILSDKKDNNELDDYIAKLENAKNTWKIKKDEFYNWESRAAYEYETVVEKLKYIEVENPVSKQLEKVAVKPGKYNEIIHFEKNNNIWKLYLL
ncbi:hypothetical protein L6259_03450 [Candidatus Parcubacteria bacterium]|nr:hypothetical protein [Patescibacteria group bacterium]MCG2694291.1 hypothetical protein [Candidatus Parcubacteria bacterium]